MKNNLTSLKIYLTIAGSIPFILCAFFFASEMKILPIFGGVDKVISIYSFLIVCFMSGAYWGLHLNREDCWAFFLPIASIIMCLASCFAFILLSFEDFLVSLIISISVFLLLDIKIKRCGMIDNDYFIARIITTLIVVVSLLIIRMSIYV